MKANRADIIARCVDDVLDGRASLEDCQRKYPALSGELRYSLEVAMRIENLRPVISPTFRESARQNIFAGASVKHVNYRRTSNWMRPVPVFHLVHVPLAILIIVVSLGSGTSVVFASQNSVPGDLLYPVKTTAEKAQMTLALTPETKASLNIKFADRRVEEIVIQTAAGKNIDADVSSKIASYIDTAIKEIGNLDEKGSKAVISQLSESAINQQVKLEQALSESHEENKSVLEETQDAGRRANTVAIVANTNPGFLENTPSVASADLEHTFKIEGRLLSTEGNKWNIGGIILDNVTTPSGKKSYSQSKQLEIKGITRDGKTFISSIEQEDESNSKNTVTIEGIFTGASADGKTWNISGISTPGLVNVILLNANTRITMTGMVQDGNFIATRLESGDVLKNEVNISGTLLEVNEDSVSINSAGAKVSVRISRAEIKTNSGSKADRSALRSSIGQEIRISNLTLKDGKLSAGTIYISDRNLQNTDQPDGARQGDSSRPRGSGDSD